MKNEQNHKSTLQKSARDGFTSGLGVILVTLGSAVGLGNIWKFPYMVGANGGAAFIIVYLISTLLVGLPVMISEHMLGRNAKSDAITSLQKLAPKKQPWWLIGAAGVLAAFVIMAFYSEVIGWVLAYIIKAASGSLLTTDPGITAASFGAVVGSPWLSLIVQWLVILYVSIIIMAGVSKGIEAAVKKLMPALLVMLIIVCIRSLTLPGASEGVSFLFKPDFSKLTNAAILTAMGLAFFKLSIGMGTMTPTVLISGMTRTSPYLPARSCWATWGFPFWQAWRSSRRCLFTVCNRMPDLHYYLSPSPQCSPLCQPETSSWSSSSFYRQ